MIIGDRIGPIGEVAAYIKPAEYAAFAELASQPAFALDKDNFLHKMELSENHQYAEADFKAYSQVYGVNGFPTVFVIDEEKMSGVQLCCGYAPLDYLKKAYEVAKEQLAE